MLYQSENIQADWVKQGIVELVSMLAVPLIN